MWGLIYSLGSGPYVVGTPYVMTNSFHAYLAASS